MSPTGCYLTLHVHSTGYVIPKKKSRLRRKGAKAPPHPTSWVGVPNGQAYRPAGPKAKGQDRRQGRKRKEREGRERREGKGKGREGKERKGKERKVIGRNERIRRKDWL